MWINLAIKCVNSGKVNMSVYEPGTFKDIAKHINM